MKKIVVIILVLFVASVVYAGNMTVKTGYGFIKDLSGNIVSKCRLSPGLYPLKNGYEYFEVNSIGELNAIQIYVEPTKPPDPSIAKKQKEDLLKVLDITEADITKLKALEVTPK